MVEMDIAREVGACLRTLELGPGATAADVRSAFRRLARSCHPDVVGRHGAARFQQIAGAYSLLKGIAPDELERLARPSAGDVEERARGGIAGWYRRRRSRPAPEAPARPRPARPEREGPERRQAEARAERVDRVLERYERSLSRRLERMERGADEGAIEDVISRLRSPIAPVRRLALGRIGALAERPEVLQALADALRRFDVDEGTAGLVSSLPLGRDAIRRLASEVADRAGAMPASLISTLLGLRDPLSVVDPFLMERYLAACGGEGVALILRHWPHEATPSDATLRGLLDSDDPRTLVATLSAMRHAFPQIAPRHAARLGELGGHPDAAVRVLARALAPRQTGHGVRKGAQEGA